MEEFDTQSLLNQTQLFWQYPVKTEQVFYDQNKENVNYCGIPWATVLDKRVDKNALVRVLFKFLKHKRYYTCCQHISFRKLIPLMKVIGIIKLYTPHKIKGEDQINGITIMPCPLYAVNIEDNTKNAIIKDGDVFNNKRQYLFSFMGGVQPDYMSNVRYNILKMNDVPDSYIENTGHWHFNHVVYTQFQNKYGNLNIDEKHKRKTDKYNNVLLNSRFSLCPSGSGPNSIRFWESLAVGAIPVLLSDTLDLPYGINWKDMIIILPENELEELPNILRNISTDTEQKMRILCINTYKDIRCNFTNNIKK
jgi:hypothetical protein